MRYKPGNIIKKIVEKSYKRWILPVKKVHQHNVNVTVNPEYKVLILKQPQIITQAYTKLAKPIKPYIGCPVTFTDKNSDIKHIGEKVFVEFTQQNYEYILVGEEEQVDYYDYGGTLAWRDMYYKGTYMKYVNGKYVSTGKRTHIECPSSSIKRRGNNNVEIVFNDNS